jgi:GTPase SAR1 family protein
MDPKKNPKVTFAQLVIGPPGAGKSTYCAGMKEFLTAMGRTVAVVNLDPANDALPYESDVDISELITLEDAMEKLHLGPNGGLIYCMEFLEGNMQWLKGELTKLDGKYVLFDCPGQVELYTHHNSVKNIAKKLEEWNFRMAAVHLVDSHYCSDPSKFISVLLTSLSTMLQVELPHINILSKVDLLGQYGKMAFNLDFYTDVLDLSYLLEHLSNDPFFGKYKKLNKALVELVEDYSLVSFVTLNVQSKESMHEVLKAVDVANGYVYGSSGEDSYS